MSYTLGTKADKKGQQLYYCEKCHYTTSHCGHWKRHTMTKKHNDYKGVTDDYTLETNADKKDENRSFNNKNCEYLCDCGKRYKYRQGLYKHKLSCTYTPPLVETETQNQIVSNNIDKDALILELLKKMSEQQEQLNKQNEVIGDLVHRVGNNNNTTNTNSHNTNINLYLNTQCKDAMSIQAFTDQLMIDIGNQPQLIGKDCKPLLDFISERITILDKTARPIHSHKKTMYLKDEAKGWNKDTKGDAANTVISSAKKAELDKLPSLYPLTIIDEKQQEKYVEAVSNLTKEVSKKDKEEFEKMDCIELNIV